METTVFNQTFAESYATSIPKSSVFARFVNWCEGQQDNRILWIGIALAGHGCVITPLTIMIVLLTGNSLALFVLATAAMGMALVTNLAALPTKITIPVFVLSLIIDIGIIITCAGMAFGLF